MNTSSLIPKYSGPFRAILLFGAPGSGKGTLGKFLSSAGNHYHLSSGDIFRGLTPESPAGQLYHSYASKGLLIPDEATIQIWHHFVHGLIATNQYFPEKQLLLLDGIPRTETQAKLLKSYIQVEQIIALEVKEIETLIKRIQRRALLEKRTDDMDTKVLQTRLEVYREDTLKVLSHYPEEKISRFNAEQKPLEILRDVLTHHCDLLST